MPGAPLLLRADAGSRIGTGHVMRCLALAQAWQDDDGPAFFVMAGEPSGISARLTGEGFSVEYQPAEAGSREDAEQTAALARRLGADWVVLDGYQFRGRFQQQIKDAGLRLLVLDDFGHAEHYWADLVLNQNLHGSETLYRNRQPGTRLLLGPRYVLLRREFRPWRGWRRTVPTLARKVLVTLGGADADNVTVKIIEALKQVSDEGLEAVVLIGGSNPHRAVLQAAVCGFETVIRLQTAVSDMAERMAWADVVIAASGTTSWERAFMGLPGLMIVLADNQVEVAEMCAAAGLGWDLGWHHAVSADAIAGTLNRLLHDASSRSAMAQRGPEQVDGRGTDRVLDYLKDEKIALRPVRPDDCRLVWEWANEPSVRAVSFSTEAISYSSHCQWFAARLADRHCLFAIATGAGGVPIGQVRCDLDGAQATMSIVLGPSFRGRGYGVKVIRLACRELFDGGRADAVLALVRPGNEASRRAFLSAGFAEAGAAAVNGCPAERYILRK